MLRIAGLAAAMGLAVGAPAVAAVQTLASPRPAGTHALASPAPGRSEHYRQDLVRLRTEFLCKRPPTAGALTAAEKAAFQARLEALKRRYGVRG